MQTPNFNQPAAPDNESPAPRHKTHNNMYTQIEKRLELAELLLQVLENPAENRVIVETQLPNLEAPWEEDDHIYYMIDKSDGDIQQQIAEDGSTTIIKEAEIYDDWQVSSNTGSAAEFPSANDVLNFFDRLAARTPIEAHVESF